MLARGRKPEQNLLIINEIWKNFGRQAISLAAALRSDWMETGGPAIVNFRTDKVQELLESMWKKSQICEWP